MSTKAASRGAEPESFVADSEEEEEEQEEQTRQAQQRDNAAGHAKRGRSAAAELPTAGRKARASTERPPAREKASRAAVESETDDEEEEAPPPKRRPRSSKRAAEADEDEEEESKRAAAGRADDDDESEADEEEREGEREEQGDEEKGEQSDADYAPMLYDLTVYQQDDKAIFKPGTRVFALWKGDTFFYPGVLKRPERRGKERKAAQRLCRGNLGAAESMHCTVAPLARSAWIPFRTHFQSRSKSFSPSGTIKSFSKRTGYKVRFDDGTSEVSKHIIHPMTLPPGEQVCFSVRV
jgi:hypothetical protein